MRDVLHRLSAKALQLADDRGSPEAIRHMAGDVRDLSTLIATWPVPASLKLGDELQSRLLQLCRQSGIALCGAQACANADGAAGCQALCADPA